MFRNILVHIPSERPVRPVIDVAVALTIARRSHLDAISIGYESMSAAGLIVDGGGTAVAAVMGAEQERAQERADAAMVVFEIEAKLAKIAYGTRTLVAIPAGSSIRSSRSNAASPPCVDTSRARFRLRLRKST